MTSLCVVDHKIIDIFKNKDVSRNTNNYYKGLDTQEEASGVPQNVSRNKGNEPGRPRNELKLIFKVPEQKLQEMNNKTVF